MLNNNEISLILTMDPKSQNLIKHIDVIYHYIRGLMEDRELAIKWIKSFAILANSLSKAFFIRLFKKY